MKINVNIIATRKYHVFVEPLLQSINKYFLLRHDVHVNLFTDDTSKVYCPFVAYESINRAIPISVSFHKIESYTFPNATWLRYHVMSSIDYDCDYIYYIDVDSLVVSEVDEIIFGDIVAVLHPGFSHVGGGSWSTDVKSTAYTEEDSRVRYFCGGFQGGSRTMFMSVMNILVSFINIDIMNGVRPEHNDESMWNMYLSECGGFKILDCDFCMVEQIHLRKLWRIDHLQPKILALEKQHNEIRS